MSRRWLVPAVAFALVLTALGWLFAVRLGGGSVYPEYSSLRADALGTRALYEALEQMPGFSVERELRPLERIGAQPRVIFLTGVTARSWNWLPAEEFTALNRALHNGARVVVAFRPYRVFDQEWHEWMERMQDASESRRGEHAKPDESSDAKKTDDETANDEKSGKETEKPARKEATRRARPERPRLNLEKEWGVKATARATLPEDAPARLATGLAEDLPATIPWQSDVYFEPERERDWRAIYVRGGRVVLAERRIGRGSLVYLGDAFHLSNEAMHRQRASMLLAWLIGEHSRATFVESHLGVVEEKSIGSLARRYGLGGALAMAALLAALYAWRRMVAFYPLRDEVERDGVVTLGHEPTAGMVALLKRSLSRRSLLAACVAEWRKQFVQGGSAAARERFEAAWRDSAAGAAPEETYNRLADALKRR